MVKALVLAAGEGTRLRPLTLNKPKPMLPIAGKPLLEHTIAWLRGHGITRIAINLHHQPEAITGYFGDGRRWGVELTYSHEETILGTAGAIKKLEGYFDDTFVVVYGDVLTDLDLTALIEFHNQKRKGIREQGNKGIREQGNKGIREQGDEGIRGQGNKGKREQGDKGIRKKGNKGKGGRVHGLFSLLPSSLLHLFPSPLFSLFPYQLIPLSTISLYRVPNPTECGIVELEADGRITRIVEKPDPEEVFSDLASAGVMVMEAGVMDFIPPNTFYDIGYHLLPDLIARGVVRVYGVPIAAGEYLIDIGTPEKYEQAQQEWKLKRE
jgi:NDP-sugar pyrophosphorylase family protein